MAIQWIATSPPIAYACSHHSHPDWEIVLNTSGEGKAVVGDETYTFRRGTILCIPPNTLHSKSAAGGFSDIFLHVDSFSMPGAEGVLLFEDDDHNTIELLMGMVLRLFRKRDGDSLAIALSLVSTIHQILLSALRAHKYDEMVEAVRHALVENYTNPQYRVSDAARVTPYCADHIRRSFKAVMGQAPMGFLLSLRLEHAENLLRQKEETGQSIGEISLASGFWDQRYFSRCFKRRIGMTPEQYALNTRRGGLQMDQRYVVE